MSYTCEWCEKKHTQEFSRTCPDCDIERQNDVHECEQCEQFYEGSPAGVCPDCIKEVQA